jgi:hypothetical protein
MLALQLDALLMALMIAVLLLLLTAVFPWILSAVGSKSKVTREELVEVVRCLKCGYESVRRHEKGDYVGKIVGSCPNDGGSLVVKAIYVEKYVQTS